MYMTRETIIELYQEAVEEGKGPQQIKALAKANHVQPGEIRKILTDAGEYVPRQKPGPKSKLKTAAGEYLDEMKTTEETEVTEETEPAAGISASLLSTNPSLQKMQPWSLAFLRDIVSRGIKNIRDELEEKRDKVESLKSDLDQLKKWYEDEARDLEQLEHMYVAAQAVYEDMQEEESNEDTPGPDAGQLVEQRSGD